jgi:hypothetical protein
MGTGGVKTWAKEASEIVENLNQALNVRDFELGSSGQVPEKIRQVGPGEFLFKSHKKEWIIKITPKS